VEKEALCVAPPVNGGEGFTLLWGEKCEGALCVAPPVNGWGGSTLLWGKKCEGQ
jgi:hypothetical protein